MLLQRGPRALAPWLPRVDGAGASSGSQSCEGPAAPPGVPGPPPFPPHPPQTVYSSFPMSPPLLYSILRLGGYLLELDLGTTIFGTASKKKDLKVVLICQMDFWSKSGECFTYDFRCLIVGIRPRDHHKQHRHGRLVYCCLHWN